jgi:hypothetical protein
MHYEISIKIIDKKYVDSLIVALVRQGYEVYLSHDFDCICYGATDEDVREVKKI